MCSGAETKRSTSPARLQGRGEGVGQGGEGGGGGDGQVQQGGGVEEK